MKLTDKTLFSLIAEDRDKKAFDELFIRWYPSLVAFAHKYVDEMEAENIVQDVMIYIWENAPQINIRHSISTYLFSAVKNRCLTHISHEKVEEKVIGSMLRSEGTPSDSSTLEEISFREILVRFHAVLDTLPEPQREAFALSRNEGKSYKEIAEIQNVSSKAVEYRIHQVLAKIRKALYE